MQVFYFFTERSGFQQNSRNFCIKNKFWSQSRRSPVIWSLKFTRSSFHWALWKAHSRYISSFWEIPPPLHLKTLFTEAPQLSYAECIDLRFRRKGRHSLESWLVLYKSSITVVFLPLLHWSWVMRWRHLPSLISPPVKRLWSLTHSFPSTRLHTLPFLGNRSTTHLRCWIIVPSYSLLQWPSLPLPFNNHSGSPTRGLSVTTTVPLKLEL